MPTGSDLGRERRARLAAARLYLVCDSAPAGRTLEALLRAAVAGGVDVVQLREKRLAEAELVAVARAAAALCRELGALFLVNDSPAVARAADADGVHGAKEHMPVARARAVLGPQALIGLSTHAL